MTGKDQYAQMTAMEADRQRIAAEQAVPDSHLRPGSIFDPNSPNYRKPKALLVAEDDDQAEVTRGDPKRAIIRQNTISKMVEDALVNRVVQPTGVNIMKVTFDEWLRVKKDPDYESFASYAQYITHYIGGKNHGQERPRPLRPFVKDEMGMLKGRIVVMTSMPGEGSRNEIMAQVPAALESPSSPLFSVHNGEKK